MIRYAVCFARSVRPDGTPEIRRTGMEGIHSPIQGMELVHRAEGILRENRAAMMENQPPMEEGEPGVLLCEAEQQVVGGPWMFGADIRGFDDVEEALEVCHAAETLFLAEMGQQLRQINEMLRQARGMPDLGSGRAH